MPDLGLQLDLNLPYRVYVLECEPAPGNKGPFYYVGIDFKAHVGPRLVKQFSGRGSCFAKAHAPTAIIFVWPAANTAVEGYVFLALLGRMPAGSIHRLGGWTQTSVAPSPLSCMTYEQDRRQMAGRCFNCGGDHYAHACQKPVQGARYRCPHCTKELVISARGQSVKEPATSSTSAAPKATASRPPADPGRPPQTDARQPSRKRPAACSFSSDQTPAAKIPRAAPAANAVKFVDVCGKQYTSLSWFLGQQNPSPSYCNRARRDCYQSALELDGGDLRTLASHGYAASLPSKPKPLLPSRTRLSSQWIETPIQTEHDIAKVRRTGATLEKSNRQVLWLVTDLETCFSRQQRD